MAVEDSGTKMNSATNSNSQLNADQENSSVYRKTKQIKTIFDDENILNGNDGIVIGTPRAKGLVSSARRVLSEKTPNHSTKAKDSNKIFET
jgi:hypothetical protein